MQAGRNTGHSSAVPLRPCRNAKPSVFSFWQERNGSRAEIHCTLASKREQPPSALYPYCEEKIARLIIQTRRKGGLYLSQRKTPAPYRTVEIQIARLTRMCWTLCKKTNAPARRSIPTTTRPAPHHAFGIQSIRRVCALWPLSGQKNKKPGSGLHTLLRSTFAQSKSPKA